MGTKVTKAPVGDARGRLLEAALKVFAVYGFEGASTRMLVKEAGVNISAIPYYFGGKEGLYEAVIRHIISMALEDRGEKAVALRAALDSGTLTQDHARVLLHDFISGFGDFLLGERASLYMAQIIVREQMRPSPVFDILYEEMMRPVHETFTRLVAFLIDCPAQSEEAVLCAHAIFGQLLVFKTHKEFALRRTGWKAYGEKERAAIIAMILQNTDAIITAHRKKASS